MGLIMRPLLEVNDFHFYYEDIHMVKGLNFHVNQGEIVTIIGAKGTGKTTTLRTISGLTKVAGIRGEIVFDGKRIDKMLGNKIIALGLGQAPQDRHVFDNLTVRENLIIGALVRKNKMNIQGDLEYAYSLIPKLLDLQKHFAGELSSGHRQMLAIGRAIIGRPKMILLDEPSLGLHPIISKEIYEIIKEINRQGTTILFAEQNSKIALATALRGYVFHNGEITLHDTCENLAVNEEVKKLICANDNGYS